MHSIRKRLFITGVIIVMGMGLTGCTKTAEKTDGGAEASGVEAENLPKAEKPEDKDALAAKVPDASDTQGNENSGEDNGKQSGEHGGQKGAASSGYNMPDGEGNLLGDIYEVGDMQFTVTEIYTDTLDDGSGIMVAVAGEAGDESAKITVVYDENTVFEKQKIWDGGANHEEKKGSAADLQKGFTAEIWGSYEGDVFNATAIKVIEVVL